MTPYVVNDEESGAAQKPKSIAVGSDGATANGGLRQLNGRVSSREEDAAETPDSLPSRSSVSGRSIIGNGKNGKSGALKRIPKGVFCLTKRRYLMTFILLMSFITEHDTIGGVSSIYADTNNTDNPFIRPRKVLPWAYTSSMFG